MSGAGFRHIALYRWAEHIDPDHIRRVVEAHDRLAARLSAELGGLVRFEHGIGLGVSADGFDYHVVTEFRTIDDWRTYRDHPDHLLLIAELLDGAIVDHASGQFAVTAARPGAAIAGITDTGGAGPAPEVSDDEIVAAARRLATERMAALLAEPDDIA